MIEFLASIPSAVWGVIGVSFGGLVAGLFSLANGRRDALAKILPSLQADVADLRNRVENLERERNAYRSWSHVLWFHIHDTSTPRIPAPVWPEDLPR